MCAHVQPHVELAYSVEGVRTADFDCVAIEEEVPVCRTGFIQEEL